MEPSSSRRRNAPRPTLQITGTVEGFEEAYQSLRNVADEKQIINILRGGIKARAQLARDEAVRIVPTRPADERPALVGRTYVRLTSSLRDSIRVTSRVKKEGGTLGADIRSIGGLGAVVTVAVRAGDRKKGVFYAHLVHEGTKQHAIPKNWRFRAAPHPGARAQPFLETAIKRTDSAGKDVFRAYVDRRMAKLIAQRSVGQL